MTTRGATLAGLLAALGRPTWWLLGLAGFLARGGILLFFLAVVTLPSPLALSNVVEPLIRPIVFGGITPLFLAFLLVGAISLVAWVVAGGWIGAATEVVLIRDARRAAVEEGLPTAPDRGTARWAIARVTAAHFVAHAPLGVAIALGSMAIVQVTYVELTNPAEIVTPLPLRIVAGAIGPIAAIIVTWLVGEIAGGIAARRIIIGRESVLRAVGGGYAELVSRPRSSLLPALLTTGVLAVDLGAMLAAVGLAWTTTRARLSDLPADPVAIGFALASFAAAWCLALVVAGLIDSWRSAAMTFEAGRASAAEGSSADHPEVPDEAGGGGTFGASAHHRPGDWSAGNEGGSL
jgi:hypothetical protein